MNVDTAEYQMIRSELAELGAAVEELANRQREDRRAVDEQIAHARGAIVRLGETCEEAILVLTSPSTQADMPSRGPGLAQVITFPGYDGEGAPLRS